MSKSASAKKVIVTSDWHLGAPRGRIGGWDDERQTYRSWAEGIDRISDMVDYANENEVDLILVAGDVFDTGIVHPEVVAELIDVLDGLSPNIEIVMIEGNHDQQSIVNNHRTPLDAYLRNHPRVKQIVKNPEVVMAKGLRIACLPWVRVGGTSELANLVEFTESSILRMAEEGADVFIGHLTLSDLNLHRGSEASMNTSVLFVDVPSSLLEQGPWKAAILGHIHTRQFFGEKVNYVGSTHQISFNEEGDAKGFDLLIFDSDNELIEREFVELSGITYFTVPYGDESRISFVKRNIKTGDKVRITASSADYDNAFPLLKEFRELGAIAELNSDPKEITETISNREGIDITVTPKEAIRDYGKRLGVSEKDLKRIVETFADLVKA